MINYNAKSPSDIRRALPVSDGSIVVRAMVPDDAGAYAAGTNDELVKLFAHLPLDHYTPRIVREMIDGAIEEGLRSGSLGVLAIADSNNDAFLGSLVIFDFTTEDAEIGYWVAAEHRGRGIARSAVFLASGIARSLGLSRLRARTVVENPASERSLLSGGFRRVGEPKEDVAPSGQSVTTLRFVRDL